jgi:hypothetical protein
VHGTVFNVLASGQYPASGQGGNNTNSNALVLDKPESMTQTRAGQAVLNHVVLGPSYVAQESLYDVPEFSAGNSLDSKQKIQDPHIDTSIPLSAPASSVSIAENKTAKSITTLNRVQGNKDSAVMFQDMDASPVKRSKRREGSMDENSSTRVERLKAKRNLYSPGMSTAKSFLSFSDDKIVSSITSLGVSLGNEVDKGLENIKTLELNRLLEVSKTELNKDKQECSNEDDASETDSDQDLDQDAIQHLVGDIADEIFGEQDSHVTPHVTESLIKSLKL